MAESYVMERNERVQNLRNGINLTRNTTKDR